VTRGSARARTLHRVAPPRPSTRTRAPATGAAVTLDALGREIRAGASLREAFHAVARAEGAGSAIGPVAEALSAGEPVSSACRRWTAAPFAATAVELAHRSGGSLARAIEGAAATVRERDALSADARVHATQAVASAVVVAAAPTAFGILIGLADPEVPGFFVGSPIGALCLVGGLSLQTLGAIWMRTMVRAT
jgi:tight adherence protein B